VRNLLLIKHTRITLIPGFIHYPLLLFILVLVSSYLNVLNPFKADASDSDFMEPKRILLLNSYHKGYLWTDDITKGIEDTLTGHSLELHIDYMDTKRQFDLEYREILTRFLFQKYRNQEYDVVITTDNNAYDLIRETGTRLIGNTPHVFCGVNYLAEKDIQGATGITGVNEQADLKKNIDLIQRL